MSDRRASGVGVITSEVRLYALSLVDMHRFQYPDIYHFKASPGWCHRFMARHNISVRSRTTIAQRLPGDYEDKFLNYQRFIINQRQINNYDVSCIGNADQTPVTFDLPHSRTIDFKGAKSISIKTTGSTMSRFTVMLTCAGDGCILPPYIIFRRKTLPKNIYWPSGVVICAQFKWWMGDDLTLDWARCVWGNYKFMQKKLLSLDAFHFHRSDRLKKLSKQQRTDLVVIPGGMTSQLQVLDVCINKIFKEGVQRQWNTWMMSENHSFTAGGRIKKPDLLLITQWIKKAWNDIDPAIIAKGLKMCCLTNNMDGTEDDVLWQDIAEQAAADEENDMNEDLLYNDTNLMPL